MKKALKTILSAILILCVGVSLCGCAQYREEKYARKRVTTYFGIEVPKNAKMTYNYYQMWQEAIGYTVFTFEKEPTAWLNEGEFQKEKDEEFESVANDKTNRFFEFRKGTDTVLPKEFVPDFDKEYFWKKYTEVESDTIFLIYVPEKLMLIFYLERW